MDLGYKFKLGGIVLPLAGVFIPTPVGWTWVISRLSGIVLPLAGVFLLLLGGPGL